MDEVLTNILSFFLGGGVFAGLVILALHNLDKLEKLVAWIYRTFSWMNKRWEYGRAATDVQATINTAGKEINKQAQNILPHAMKIEWAKDVQAVETFLRKGEVIIKMGYSKDQNRNLVVATLAYVEKDLLPNTRPYVDKTLIKAADYTIAKEVFTSSGRDAATSLFLQDCLEPEIAAGSKLGDDCIMLEQINNVGYFSRIFLTQLRFLGDKLFPAAPNPAVQRETRGFAEFLTVIVTKERGEDADLDFTHPRIRVKVMLVARKETKEWGTSLYDRRIKEAQSDGIEYVYIAAWGEDNNRFAERVAREQETAGRLTVLSISRFVRSFSEGPPANAICIVCALNLKKSPEDALEAPGVLSHLLEEHVDEVREGKVEVIAIARHPGILSKIIVKALVDDLDVVGCFTKQLHQGQLGTALGNESLHIIQWQDNPVKMIVASLSPLKADEVTDLELKEEEHIAIVRVRGAKAVRKAIGRKGMNVKLASKLTGWYIHIGASDDIEETNDEPTLFMPDD